METNVENLERISRREAQIGSILYQIVSEKDLKKVLSLILKCGTELLNMDAGVVSLLHSNTPGEFSYYATLNIPTPYKGRIVREESNLISQIASAKELIVLKNFTPDTPFAKMWHGLGYKVVVAASIVYQDEVIGFMHFGSTDPNLTLDVFKEESLQIYAEYAGIAVRNAQMFEELRKHRDHLDSLVKERTAELNVANKQLRHEIAERKEVEEVLERMNRNLESTVKKLRESNDSNRQLQEFTYIASHDLKEPLRKISSFGQLLAESLEAKLNDDERENLDFMIDGANRMQQMIESLLVYSRVTTQNTKFEEVDLNEVVEQLKNLELASELEETTGSILVPEYLPVVKADPAQMRQLFQNVIANALKYHKEGVAPEVTIRSAGLGEDGMVHIEVHDNGIGIKREQCQNVFVMFRRLHSRREYDGMGIGLAVCKRIIERHRGEIGVKSAYGEGSTFWFTLPVL